MPDLSIPSDPDFAARVRASFARQGFMTSLGAELTRVEPGACEIHLPFRDGLGQQHGAIADSAGGYAGYTLMGANDSVLSVEFKMNLVAPARGDAAVARARVVKSGRTLTVCQVEVFVERDGAETLCALLQQTLIRMADRPDTAAT